MFDPKYAITDQLLANITRIQSIVAELNNQRFPQPVLFEFEKTARALSSFASTSIEGNPLPLTEVKRILKSAPDHVRDSEREVLNYNQALLQLHDKLDQTKFPFNLELILAIHQQVTDKLLPASEVGRLRQKPVVVNDPHLRKIVYLPPDANDVESLMRETIDFIHASQNRVHHLILAGIFHKQMVIIHPFMDGNGRTVRLVTKALLAAMGLNTFNLFSFEQYYNQNVTKYFHTVGEYGNYYDLAEAIDFTPWLEYFNAGIIDELLRVQKLLPTIGLNPATELKQHHVQILELIRDRGFVTDQTYGAHVERSKASRALDFQKLIELKLIDRKAKGRATYYVLKGEQ